MHIPLPRSKSRISLALLLATSAALAGCASWTFRSDPDDYIGPTRSGNTAGQAYTDPTLTAVRPVVPGDVGASVMPLGSTTRSSTNPSTQPASTAPTTAPAATLPAVSPPTANRGTASVPGVLSVQDAILVGLQNSSSLRVQRFSIPIRRTGEDQALSKFDPSVSGSISGGANNGGRQTTNSINGSLGINEFLPTGTTIEGNLTTGNTFYNDASSSTGANVTVTQALLRGAGLNVNLASIREAVIDTHITQYQLRAFTESLVASIESTYWDLAYAERQVEIVENSLIVAREQLANIREQIRVGRVAATEDAAADAEVQLRNQELINARSAVETTRLRLLQLISPPGEPFWDRELTLHTEPFIPDGTLDPVDAHVDVALQLRPEMNQTRLQIQRGDLEVVQTKNGLLPRLDFFVTLGKTGFASSFGESIANNNGPDFQALVGVRGDISPINRSASASYRASVLNRDQQEETLRNLATTVQLDVRTQYLEVIRTRQQIDASAATLRASQTAFDVEVAKFRADRSTSLLVAQAQRDLLNAQLSRVQSVTNHLKALVTLYRLEGSLLYRRGLDAPGGAPTVGR